MRYVFCSMSAPDGQNIGYLENYVPSISIFKNRKKLLKEIEDYFGYESKLMVSIDEIIERGGIKSGDEDFIIINKFENDDIFKKDLLGSYDLDNFYHIDDLYNKEL